MIASLIGFVVGLLTTMPIGPINVTVLTKGMRESFAHGISIAVGAASMDFLYSLAAMYGLFAILQAPLISRVFQCVGILLLITFGVQNIRSKLTKIDNGYKLPLKRKLHSNFWIGVFLYLSNPTFIGMWLTIAGSVHAYHFISHGSDNLFFATGVGLGAFGWYYIMLRYFHNRKDFMKPGTLQKISVFSGIALLGFGCYLCFELIVSLLS
ncbi:MAG: LysE family transporter [Bacteroidota bacterium]